MIFKGGPDPLSPPLDPHKGSPDATVMVNQNLNKNEKYQQGRLNGKKLSPAVQGQLHEIAWCTREIAVQRLACASNPVSGCKRLSRASNHEGQVFSCNGFSIDDKVRESGSTLIAIIIILEC